MASRLSRLAKLGTLTTQVGSSYIGQAVKGIFQGEEARQQSMDQLHKDNAERIVAQLGSLKGAAMKVGQAFAQAVDGYNLPPEAKAMLSRLHDKAEPVPFETIQRRVEAELGGGLSDLFREFDPAPLGTASLGQAHAAILKDGTPVVVKVLHEGVEDSVQTDLSALKTMLFSTRLIKREKEELEAMFTEISSRLAEELDYELEAQNLGDFRRFFHDDPDVLIPQVFPGWSSKKILTMERLPGRPLPVFLATASEAARQKAGLVMARTYMRSEYVFRAVHADPHPGNFLFQPDGRVGYLDFGCVRRLDLEFVADYAEIGFHSVAGDRDRAMQIAHKIGFLTQRHAPSEDLLWELIDAIGLAFTTPNFQMGSEADIIHERVARVMPSIVAQPIIQAPTPLIFLHRALGGTYQILRQLKVRGDWGEMFRRYGSVALADRALARARTLGASP